MVPSGASTGANEAVELRDGDERRYNGKGVLKAVEAVNEMLGPAHRRARRHGAARDRRKARSSSTARPTKSNLGANAIARRFARRRARRGRRASRCRSFAISAARLRRRCPVPMMNVINGGKHAEGALAVSRVHDRADRRAERSAKPCATGRRSFTRSARSCTSAACRRSSATRAATRRRLETPQQALDLIVAAIERAGYRAGERRGDRARSRVERVLSRRHVLSALARPRGRASTK